VSDLIWSAIAPELVLVTLSGIILVIDVWKKPPLKSMALLVGAGLVATWAAWGLQLSRLQEIIDAGSFGALAFNEMVITDGTAVIARFILMVILTMAVALAWPMLGEIGQRSAEALVLMFLATAGFMLLAASTNLVMAFIGLEVGSISLYVLAAVARKSRLADEAAMKYFLLGSFASAVFIYGVALLYAGSGSVSIDALRTFSGRVIVSPGVLYVSMAMLVVGVLFKVTAAPFHAWAPDVYQGSAAGVVGFMAAAAKVGGFAALIRIVGITYVRFASDWRPALAAIAALSIVLGTLLALSQTDFRRMLAYSGIAHAGFILVGVAAGRAANEAILFYLAVYTVQLVTAFGIAAIVSGPTSSGSPFSAYKGLASRSPFLAAGLATTMLGMSGMPITSGFIGKLGVFRAAWERGLEWLVVVALVASVAAFFFYLRVIVDMYMRDPDEETADVAAEPQVAGRLAIAVAVVVTVLFGLYPSPLLDLIRNVVS
jgi:NADH-quinone oxidoreductase subunit N